jgi:hypothetical protein
MHGQNHTGGIGWSANATRPQPIYNPACSGCAGLVETLRTIACSRRLPCPRSPRLAVAHRIALLLPASAALPYARIEEARGRLKGASILLQLQSTLCLRAQRDLPFQIRATLLMEIFLPALQRSMTAPLCTAQDWPDIIVLESEFQAALADVRLGNTFKSPDFGIIARYQRDQGDTSFKVVCA